jgi:hypothetical protein
MFADKECCSCCGPNPARNDLNILSGVMGDCEPRGNARTQGYNPRQGRVGLQTDFDTRLSRGQTHASLALHRKLFTVKDGPNL